MTWQITITGWDWGDLSEVWGLPFWPEMKACEEQESVQIRKLLGIISVLCLLGTQAFTQPLRLSSVFSTDWCCCEHNAREGDDHSRWWACREGIFAGREGEREWWEMGDLWCHRTAVHAHHGVTARGSCWHKPDKTTGSKKWLKMVYQI